MCEFTWLAQMPCGTDPGFEGPAVHVINGVPHVVTVTRHMLVAVEGAHGYPDAMSDDARMLRESPNLRPLAVTGPSVDLARLRAFCTAESVLQDEEFAPVRLGRVTFDAHLMAPWVAKLPGETAVWIEADQPHRARELRGDGWFLVIAPLSYAPGDPRYDRAPVFAPLAEAVAA